MNFDSRGIPGISVVTTGFTDAVEVQSKALGFDPAILYVPHPIQNRTAEELGGARLADVEQADGQALERFWRRAPRPLHGRGFSGGITHPVHVQLLSKRSKLRHKGHEGHKGKQ